MSEARTSALEHGAKLPLSRLHSNVEPDSVELNVKVGEASFDGSPGFVTIVVSGGVRSTVTSTSELAVRSALSVATARRARWPSAGIAQPTPYWSSMEADGAVSEHWKNSTCFTPLPASLAVAASAYGSAEAALT